MDKMSLAVLIAFVGTLATIGPFWVNFPLQSLAAKISLLIFTLRSLLMFSSSFIESEGAYWFWVISAWFLVMALKNRQLR